MAIDFLGVMILLAKETFEAGHSRCCVFVSLLDQAKAMPSFELWDLRSLAFQGSGVIAVPLGFRCLPCCLGATLAQDFS